MVRIRPLGASDLPIIMKWWAAANEPAPPSDTMPLESSFVAEVDGKPVLSVSVLLTNSPSLAYTENFIGAPDSKGASRREAALMLSDHIAAFAKARGCKYLACIAYRPKLWGRYEELGYVKTLEGVSTFVRQL